jgi:hypothetical protein
MLQRTKLRLIHGVDPSPTRNPGTVATESTTRSAVTVEAKERLQKEKEGALAAEQHVPELNLAGEQEIKSPRGTLQVANPEI